jgi:hypothetical protein
LRQLPRIRTDDRDRKETGGLLFRIQLEEPNFRKIRVSRPLTIGVDIAWKQLQTARRISTSNWLAGGRLRSASGMRLSSPDCLLLAFLLRGCRFAERSPLSRPTC